MEYLIEEFTYGEQIESLIAKARLTDQKARAFVKGYRMLLKQALARGEKIEIPGMLSIWPSVRENVMEVFDDPYTYHKQVEDLADVLSNGKEVSVVFKNEVHQLLLSYLKILFNKLKQGYVVKISGVISIKPFSFNDGTLGYMNRLSPTLAKPDSLKLKVEYVYGNTEERLIEKEKIIFRVLLDEKLGVPNTLRKVSFNRNDLVYIDDVDLG